jgi:hypothetical protein
LYDGSRVAAAAVSAGAFVGRPQDLALCGLSGRPPRNEGSCVIHLRVRAPGADYDHATGELAGPIDLIHHTTGLTNASLFEKQCGARASTGPRPLHR